MRSPLTAADKFDVCADEFAAIPNARRKGFCQRTKKSLGDKSLFSCVKYTLCSFIAENVSLVLRVAREKFCGQSGSPITVDGKRAAAVEILSRFPYEYSALDFAH